MSAKTSRSFIFLLISAAASLIAPLGARVMAMAPAGPITATEADKPSSPAGSAEGFFRGIYLSADVFGYIYPIFVKDKYYSAEVSAAVNLKNRFFPVVEVGFGHTDMVSQLYEIGYRTQAPYYRIGMDYNMQYENGKPNYIYLGGRIGYTSFDYSVDAPALKDPIWGGEAPMQLPDMPCRTVWAEAVGGVRAEIAKNFYMGWSLRYRYPIYKGPIANGGPWYIPGFGASSKAAFGATYSITYYLNFSKKRP